MDFLQTVPWNGSCSVFMKRTEVPSKIQLFMNINLLIPEDWGVSIYVTHGAEGITYIRPLVRQQARPYRVSSGTVPWRY